MARNGFKACKGIGTDGIRLDVDMGNYTKQIEAREERKERDKTRREKLAGFFFNLSQVSFTALVIGIPVTLFKEELYDNYILMIMLVIGIIFTFAFAKIGNNILK